MTITIKYNLWFILTINIAVHLLFFKFGEKFYSFINSIIWQEMDFVPNCFDYFFVNIKFYNSINVVLITTFNNTDNN